MENMIEKLKNNLCQWQYMPKEEKEYMKSLPLGAVGIVGKSGSLFIFPVKPWFDSKEDIYRIVPDYEPEPVKLIVGRRYKIAPKEEEECTSLDKGIYTISCIEKNGIFAVEEKPEGFEGVRRGDSSLYDFELIDEPEIKLTLPTEEETKAAEESEEAALEIGVRKFNFLRNATSFSGVGFSDLRRCALCKRHERLDGKTNCPLKSNCVGLCTESWNLMRTCYWWCDLAGFKRSAEVVYAEFVLLLCKERAKKKEPEIIRCEVKEINGNLYFIENCGPVRLYKALSRANYIRCEDEEGKPCSLRECKKQRLNQPARWPKWVLFKNKVSK